jgi:hypothetical protein
MVSFARKMIVGLANEEKYGVLVMLMLMLRMLLDRMN